MKFTAKQYAIALYQNLEKSSPEEEKRQIINFIKLLKHNRQLNLSGKIINKLDKLIKEKNDVLEVEAITAAKIEENELSRLLAEKLNRKISLKIKVDETIIAGLILRINDSQIDGSVKTQLKLLNNKLSNN